MRKLLKTAIVLAVVLFILFFKKTNYFLILPGSAENLRDMVHVAGAEGRERGGFYMVTVLQQPANLAFYLYGLVHPDIDVRPASLLIPPEMSEEEYRQLMQSWMRDSKLLAKVIALRRAGYEVEIKSSGVEVVDFQEESPAKGILKQGDIIVAVDGEAVNLAEDVVTLIQSREVGEDVIVEIERNGSRYRYTVNTISSKEEPDKPILGVYVRTLSWEPVLPINIEIETGNISGPSAGMMFVLEILDQLLPGDLTGGKKIAGTGTINLQEEVGGIGGVKQKVIAAEKEGADYFLVPRENYLEAKDAASKIELVPVETLEDALLFFQKIQEEAANTALQLNSLTGYSSLTVLLTC